MRVLLTGTSGFTGRHLALAVQAAGHEWHGLEADLTDKDAVLAEVSAYAPEWVVHLAAISTVTHPDPNALYGVNLFGTLNLLEALSLQPHAPQKIVLASSAYVYGNSPVLPIDETVVPAPVNHYAMSKLAMEHMTAPYRERLPIVIARPFNYTGVWHDERFVIPKIVMHFARRDAQLKLGNIHVLREYNDVRTVCEAYLRLLQYGEAGEVYNICSNRPIALQKVIDILAEISGYRPEIKINPALLRSTEIHRLCGSPARLEACVGPLHHPAIDETLRWMYEAARAEMPETEAQ